MTRKSNHFVMKRRYTKEFRSKPKYKRKSKYGEDYYECVNRLRNQWYK